MAASNANFFSKKLNHNVFLIQCLQAGCIIPLASNSLAMFLRFRSPSYSVARYIEIREIELEINLSLPLTRICVNISTVYNDTLVAKGLKRWCL